MLGAAVLKRRSRPREDGFTLIELVLAVGLLGVIGAAVVGSFLVMLSTKERTSDALDASRDQQFLATYFTDDVAGLRTVSAGSQTVCGSSVSALVVLHGTDFDPGSTSEVATTVAWVHRPATRDLARISCRGVSPGDTRVVARDVPSAPTVSTSCTATVPVFNGASPAELSLTVPSTSGSTAVLCGRRRAT